MDSIIDTGVCSADMHADSRGVIQHGTLMVGYSSKPYPTAQTYR
jgi:hypothetical protein